MTYRLLLSMIIFVHIPFLANCNTKDSTHFEKRIDLITTDIDKELYLLRSQINEKNTIDVLKLQTAIFSLITTISIAIIGYFSYFGFKREVSLFKENIEIKQNFFQKEMQEEIESQNKIIVKHKSDTNLKIEDSFFDAKNKFDDLLVKFQISEEHLLRTRLKIATTSVNSLLAIGNYYLSINEIDSYVFHYLLAVKEQLYVCELNEDNKKDKSRIKKVIQSLFINIYRLQEINDFTGVFVMYDKQMLQIIDDVYNCSEDFELKNMCTKFRIQLIKISARLRKV